MKLKYPPKSTKTGKNFRGGGELIRLARIYTPEINIEKFAHWLIITQPERRTGGSNPSWRTQTLKLIRWRKSKFGCSFIHCINEEKRCMILKVLIMVPPVKTPLKPAPFREYFPLYVLSAWSTQNWEYVIMSYLFTIHTVFKTPLYHIFI